MSLLPDILQQVQWSDSAGKWYWPVGGVNTGFVSESVIAAELAAHQTATAATLQSLTADVFAGNISIEEWQAAVALELKNAALAQAAFANGGFANMTQADFGRVGQMLREQYGFLNNFAQGVADGSITEGQAGVRIGMYSDSTEAAYWDAWRANQGGGEDLSNLPLLTQSPRDGNQQCLTNCRCTLDTNEDGSVNWNVTGDQESCPDCLELGAGGPYRTN